MGVKEDIKLALEQANCYELDLLHAYAETNDPYIEEIKDTIKRFRAILKRRYGEGSTWQERMAEASTSIEIKDTPEAVQNRPCGHQLKGMKMYVRKFIDKAGKYRFTKKGDNHEPTTTTSQGYKHKRSRDIALQRDIMTPLNEIKFIDDDGNVEERGW